jgi:WD40 repeat protein
VGIFEVVRDSATETSTGLKLSFALAGHESDVVAMAWNMSGKRLVTCCEDGVWRLWDVTVRYNEAEQPRLFSGTVINCISYVMSCLLSLSFLLFSTPLLMFYRLLITLGHQTLPGGLVPSQVAIMKGGLVAFACDKDLYFCASGSGEVVEHIADACVQPIRAMRTTADGTKIATVVENVKRIGIWSAPE